MGRRLVGDWADMLPPSLRPAAIIGLGVLVADLWEHHGDGRPKELVAGGVQQLARAYESLFKQLERFYYPKRLRWGHNDAKRWDHFKQHLPAHLVAEAWISFSQSYGLADLETWPYHDSDGIIAAETYAWLTKVAWDSNARVRSVFATWWDGYSTDARNGWHWPLQLGFLDDPKSRLLLEQFHRNEHAWIRTLATAVNVERTGFSCDLLISPLAPRETAEALMRAKAHATAVALMNDEPFGTPQGAAAVADLRRAASAASVALIAGGPGLDLAVEIIREISHNQPLDAAVNQAARRLGVGSPLVISNSHFIYRSPISQLGENWAKILAQLGQVDAASAVRSMASAPYLSEGGTASALAAIAAQARPSQPRYIQAATWRPTGKEQSDGAVFLDGPLEAAPTLIAGRWHVLAVSIGPAVGTATSDLPAFPDEEIGWDGGPQTLQIAISAPGCDVIAAPPHTLLEAEANASFRYPYSFRIPIGERASETAIASLTVEPIGRSELAAFFLRPRQPSELKARIVALHRNRILQTAILHGAVLEPQGPESDATLAPDGSSGAPARGTVQEGRTPEPIRLLTEGVLRASLQDLDDRPMFDLALLTNDSLTGRPQVTAFSDTGVLLRDFTEVKEAAERIAQRLRGLTEDPEDFDSPASEAMTLVLKMLAHEGVLLRDRFDDCGLRPILRADPTRIQVVSAKPDEILPLEFIYDGMAPDPKTAQVCPQQADALAAGACGSCPNRMASSHVCAMRFWGVRKVIERHLYDPETAPFLDRVSAEPPSDRLKRIPCPKSRAFASSRRAQNFPGGPAAIGQLKRRLGMVSRPQDARSGNEAALWTLHAVDTWTDWRERVREHAPALMVLLPHTDLGPFGEVLEIGDADTLTNAQIDQTVVGTSPPMIVLLLGCGTASAQVRYANFVARFRQAKASVVIGTLTPVLGRHAAPVAEALVEQLDQYWSEPFQTVTVGDAMSEIRRRLMGRGLPVGLAVVAFGDADWLLAAEPC